MQIDILTIFPEMFESPFSESILKRAQDKNLVQIKIHNLRDWTTDNHRSVDDRPFEGGAGMIMRVDVVDRALHDLKSKIKNEKLESKVILLDTKGEFYTQQKAQILSEEKHLIFIVPHYEGIDYRVHKYLADEAICIGPYILTGGELPTMVVVDSIVRLLPGAINEESLREESFQNQQPTTEILSPKTYPLKPNIEYPQYTRPAEYKGWKVPEILLSGNHKEIEEWRRENEK
ncbi:tRNA (guanosine(37)-N1)-methyltransferase TrmD [Candidatus Beckwithbacteria bacterium]|nr:tRNA (guanosine(37)-N1)-methyltransferase TrmD [Candidatus Beckwithbacteria bacterium]